MKLPSGMFKRGSVYYVRRRQGRKIVWHNLGPYYGKACAEYARVLGKRREAVSPNSTVALACERWMQTYVALRSPRFQKVRESRTKPLVEHLGAAAVTRLDGSDLEGYRKWLEQKYAPQTVKNMLADLRCLLLWCVRSGMLEKSPFPPRLMPKLQERPPDRLTDEEIQALCEYGGDPHAWIIRLALGTGLRWGELCRAQASDLKQGMLTVHRTKSSKLRRVPVPPDLEREIRQHVGRLCPFDENSTSTFNLTVRRRLAMAIEDVPTRKWLPCVGGFHVHQTRHTFATKWVEEGRSLAALRLILGHSSITTTERYAKLSDEFVKSEARRESQPVIVQQVVQQRVHK